MFNRSKTWALALLAAVFVAGAAAGWFGHDWTGRGSRLGRRGRDAMVGRLATQLHLTPTQRDSVRAICERHRRETAALWREMHPRYDSVRTRLRVDLDAQLTPEQQVRYRRLIEEKEHRHRMPDSTERQGDERR
jgi:Spy/CpxP family protein refolding chaperone